MSLADYNRVKVIGKGSYGEVWLVKHRFDKKQYVLKKIDLSSSSTKERESAEQEAKLLSGLKHPNIVAYKDSFESKDGFLYIAMGFCEGGDVYERLKKQNGVFLEEKQIVEWFVQISMALQYLHDRNILHRDLKTQNIFLTRSKIVKLGDLGIARVLDSSTDMATTLIGTPYYMSPELFSNKPYNHKSDVWALGCCVYEMTTLKHAFNAKDMNSLVYKILKGKMPSMPRNYSTDLCTLIRLMLHQNPDLRPSVNQILRNNYIKKNIASFLESTKQRRSSLASAGSERGSRPIPAPPSGRPRRPRGNEANNKLPALFNNNNDVRGNQVAPLPRPQDAAPIVVHPRGGGGGGGRKGWSQPEVVEPAVQVAEAPLVYRVDPVNLDPLAKKPGDLNPPHQQPQQPQPRRKSKDSRPEMKANQVNGNRENNAGSDAEERKKVAPASAARERRRKQKEIEQKEVAALPSTALAQQQPQEQPPAPKDQRPLPKPPPSKQQPAKSTAGIGAAPSSSSAESNHARAEEIPKISGARERRRQKKSQEALEAAAARKDAAAAAPAPKEDVIDGRPASARSTTSTASSGSSRSTTSSVGGGGRGADVEQRAAVKMVWRSRETKSSASSIDSDDDSESKGRGVKKEEISSFIELLDNTLNLNEVPEDLEATTKATCGGSLDDIGDATLVAAEVAEDVPVVVDDTIKVVSVGGSESSSGGKGGGGGLKPSPRYDGAMTITASGRLLDRINRLRRDCIKALGFNVLAQAYEVLEDVEESEMEKRLLDLLGQEKFDLYAGKIWQLKFCEDSAFNLK